MRMALHIAVCGIDGSGKSTQARLLVEALNRTQPGRTVLADYRRGARRALRELDDRGWPVPAALRAIGHAYDLADAYLEAAGRTVPITVWDRHLPCLRANFGALGVTPADLAPLLRLVPEPDLAIVLDLDPALALERQRRRDGLPAAGAERRAFFSQARSLYQAEAATRPATRLLPAAMAESALHEMILKLVTAFLAKGEGAPDLQGGEAL